jgi:hypothetical protein
MASIYALPIERSHGAGDCEVYGNSEFEIAVFTLGFKPSRLSLLAADIQVCSAAQNNL